MNERTCIVTKKAKPHDALIRFAASPDGKVTPDLKARLPGRGAWVSASAEAVRIAAGKGLFARAFRKPVKADPDLDRLVGSLLKKRAFEALGMAMKAGYVLTGFAKVMAAVKKDNIAVLIEAGDGAEDGKRKLMGAAGYMEKPAINIDWFSSSELGLALGRQNVVHAAIKHGRMAQAFLLAAQKWRAYEDAAENMI